MSNRARDDQISKVMGAYLLKGYAMLDEYCPKCQTPLMRSRQGVLICVACDDVDQMEEKKKIEEPQRDTLGSQQEVASNACPCSHEKMIESESGCASESSHNLLSSNTNSHIKEDIEKGKMTLERKMKWAIDRLERCNSVDCCIQLCSLIKQCSDTLLSITSLENVVTND